MTHCARSRSRQDYGRGQQRGLARARQDRDGAGSRQHRLHERRQDCDAEDRRVATRRFARQGRRRIPTISGSLWCPSRRPSTSARSTTMRRGWTAPASRPRPRTCSSARGQPSRPVQDDRADWGGCIETRRDALRGAPAAYTIHANDTLYVPYFAPDEPGAKGDRGRGTYNNSYLDDSSPRTSATFSLGKELPTCSRTGSSTCRAICSSTKGRPAPARPGHGLRRRAQLRLRDRAADAPVDQYVGRQARRSTP